MHQPSSEHAFGSIGNGNYLAGACNMSLVNSYTIDAYTHGNMVTWERWPIDWVIDILWPVWGFCGRLGVTVGLIEKGELPLIYTLS